MSRAQTVEDAWRSKDNIIFEIVYSPGGLRGLTVDICSDKVYYLLK